MKKNLIKSLLLSVVMVTASLTAALVSPMTAHAATRTWTGGGSDAKISTSGNWSTGVAPTAGDDLVFPANVTNRTVNNDLTAGTSFNSITFNGSSGSDGSYTVGGNSMAVVAGISNSITDAAHLIQNNVAFSADQTIGVTSGSIIFEGVLSGSGNLTKTGAGSFDVRGANTFTGNLVANAGIVTISSTSGTLGTTAGNTQINDGASLTVMTGSSSMTIAEPIVLTGAAKSGLAKVNVNRGFGPLTGNPTNTATFTGQITLSNDVSVTTGAVNANLSNVVLNGHSITRPDGTFGTLTVNGAVASASGYSSTTLSGSQPGTDETVDNHTIAVLGGTRGNVTVYYDGTLKGTGTVGQLNVMSGGTLAEGQSPGCIASGNVTLSGTLTEELAGGTPCSEYDQLQVTGTVTLGGTLNVSLLSNFAPTANQVFTIISNDGSDAVSGTFSGLAEGAIVTVSGHQFRISYVGGDGNDVTLTAVNVPSVPNTGFALKTSNPLLVASAGITAVLALVMTRKYLFNKR